jgi:hypothetical protein
MKTQVMLMMVAVVLAAMALPATAAKQTAPAICGAHAFTAPTRYMSLAGYVRWQQYTSHRAWISHSQAARLTEQQLRTCPMPQRS